MRHLFLATNDYAASGNGFCLALRAVGEDTRCLIEQRHVYDYPAQGEKLDPGSIADAVDWADWIWVIQTDLPRCMGGTNKPRQDDRRDKWLEVLKAKRVALLHGGGTFRNNRQFYADLWRGIATLSICYEADLIGSFENEHLVIPPVDLRWFVYCQRQPGPLRVGHFPSRPTDKGSEWIVPLLAETDGIEFRTSVKDATARTGVEAVPWPRQLARMSACDVIVDQIKPVLDGFAFGEWVSIATEAAALGRISIANSLNPWAYLRTYGRMPGIHICNDQAALVTEIDRLRGVDDETLQAEQRASRDWIAQHHTLEPTGKLLKRLCGLS